LHGGFLDGQPSPRPPSQLSGVGNNAFSSVCLTNSWTIGSFDAGAYRGKFVGHAEEGRKLRQNPIRVIDKCLEADAHGVNSQPINYKKS
jgi:hypothetical protein